MKQDKALNVAIVGGGRACKSVIDMIFSEKFKSFRMKLIGVADINPHAVGYCYAQGKGIYATENYRDLYNLKDLNMIIELTSRDDIAEEISQTRPHHVRFMDHVAGRLFWDIFHIEEQRIAERKQAEDALRQDGRFLQSVFDSVQDGMTVLDCEFNIIRVNPWMEKMYASRIPLLGKKCYEAYQRRRSPCPGCPLLRTLQTGEAHSEMLPFPSEKNPTRWIDLSAFPLKNPDGRLVGIIKYIKDITERKLAEEALCGRVRRNSGESITNLRPLTACFLG